MEMTHGELMTLIDELAKECVAHRITGIMTIYGGCAMMFHHPDLRATHDVDSVFRPYQQIKELAESIALRHAGVDQQWLNMQVRDVLPIHDDDAPITYFNKDGFTIRFASQRYLLAMKAMSDRHSQKDLDDAAILFNALHLRNWMDIDNIVHQYFGNGSAGAQELFMEDIEDRAAELAAQSPTAQSPTV